MKAIQLLLSTVMISSVAADLTSEIEGKERVSHFEFMGVTDLNVVDGIEGLASGLFDKDVRPKYDTCYEGMPTIIDQIKDEVFSIDFKDIMNWTKDWTELKDSWGFVSKMISELPEEFGACSVLVTEIVEGVTFLIGNLSFSLLWTNVTSNPMGIVMQLMGKITDAATSAGEKELYRAGKDVGESIMTVLHLGRPKKE